MTLTALDCPLRWSRSSACASHAASGGSSAKIHSLAALKSMPSAAAVTEMSATRTDGSW